MKQLSDITSYIKRHKKACIGGTGAGIVLLLLLLFLLIFPLDTAEGKTKAVLGTSTDMETTEGLVTTQVTTTAVEATQISEQTETAVSETTIATTAETIAVATKTPTPKTTTGATTTSATTAGTATATTTATTIATTTATTTTAATEPPTPKPSTYPTEEEMEAYIWTVVISHRTSADFGTPTYDQAMTDRAQLYSDPDTTSWSILAQVDVHDQVGYQLNGTWDGFATWQEDVTDTVNAILSSWETHKDTTGQTLCGVGVGYELRPSGVYFYSVWICFAKVT